MEEEKFFPRLMTIGQLASYYFPYEYSMVTKLRLFERLLIDEGVFRYLSYKPKDLNNPKTVIKPRYVWVVVRHIGWPPYMKIN